MIESSPQLNLVYSYRTLVHTDYPVSSHPSCTSFIYQLSSLTIIYFILGLKSFSPTFLVAMSVNCRSPSNQSILCILHFSQFLIKCTPILMCLVCLVSLPLLSIQKTYFLSNIIRGASSVNVSGSLFNNSWINILKCDKYIPEVHATLYSLYAPDWETGPGTCVPWSIVPHWWKTIYAPVCMTVSVKSC